MELIVAAVAVFCALGFLFWSSRKTPPGPWGLPIVGHLHLLGSLPHQSLAEMSRKYGPLMMIKLGTVPTVIVSSAELAKEFLTTHDSVFASRPKVTAPYIIFYKAKDVVWTPYGPHWRHMRKVCMVELFTAKRIGESRNIRSEEISLFLESIMVEGREGEALIDMNAKLSVLAMNVVTRMTISQRLFSASSQTLIHLIHEMFSLLGVFHIGDYVPALSWLDPKGHVLRLQQVHKKVDVILQEIIHEHREQRSRPHDLVDILLSLEDVDDEAICGIILNMIAAGTDTSTVTVEWALSELMNNQKFMLRAQEEMDKVVGKERLVTESDLPNLKFLKATLKEVFRLHPAAPLLIPHESTEESKIRGYTIPKKSRLVINVWAIGRDPSLWDTPEEFNPDRFVENAMDVRGQDFELLPFGSGRRMCPAVGLGLCMIELMMASLVQGFEWRSVNGQPLDMQEMGRATLPKKVPLAAFAKPRLPKHLYWQ